MLLAGLIAAIATAATPDLGRALRESQAVVGREVGDHAFTDRDGNRVRLSDYRGKPLLVSFVYTGCSQVCPTTTKFLGKAVQQAQDALGPDAFSVVTIGFNLPFDNPAAMKAFARQQGIDQPHWNFLSPDAGTVDGLLHDFGFTFSANASGFDHLTQVSIVDANGRVFRQVYGETFELPMLVGPLRQLRDGTPAPVQDLADLVAARAHPVQHLRPAHRQVPAGLRPVHRDLRRLVRPGRDRVLPFQRMAPAAAHPLAAPRGLMRVMARPYPRG